MKITTWPSFSFWSACSARVYGLRLDVYQLTEDERLQLIELGRASSPPDQVGYGAVALAQLTKAQRRDLERIVERASGAEPGALAKAREEAKVRAEIMRVARAALRRPLSPEAEAGLLAEIHAQMAASCLWPSHVAALVTIFACMSEAAPLTPGGSVTRDPDGEVVLRLNASVGLFPGGDQPFSIDVLSHLRANAWITYSRGDNEIEVRLGSRGRRALEPVLAAKQGAKK